MKYILAGRGGSLDNFHTNNIIYFTFHIFFIDIFKNLENKINFYFLYRCCWAFIFYYFIFKYYYLGRPPGYRLFRVWFLSGFCLVSNLHNIRAQWPIWRTKVRTIFGPGNF